MGNEWTGFFAACSRTNKRRGEAYLASLKQLSISGMRRKFNIFILFWSAETENQSNQIGQTREGEKHTWLF